ncbi:Hypothetical protein, putative, partial [Bodo saltans]
SNGSPAPVATQTLPPRPSRLVEQQLRHDAVEDHAVTVLPAYTTVPHTTAQHRRTPPPSAPRPSTPVMCKGIDLSSHDPNTHEQPGGTEEEALKYRRTQSSLLWPLPHHNHIPWRSNDGSRPTGGQHHACVEQEVADGMYPWQWHHRASQPSQDGAPGCSLSDFACRLKAYRTLMPQSAVINSMCDGVYGAQLVDRFRASDVPLCSSTGTTLKCKMLTVHSTHDADTCVCRAQHSVVAYDMIHHGDYPWLDFRQGALELACSDTPEGSRIRSEPQKHFMHCIADWMTLGYHSVGEGRSPLACDAKLLCGCHIVTRSGDYSPFALTHDWINLVVLLAVEGLRTEDIQIVMMDRMTTGFYTPVWQYAFSPGRPLMWYPDIHDPQHSQHRGRVCYRNAYFNIPARLSPIYNEDECGSERPGAYRSPLYHVYRDHILHTFRALNTVGGMPGHSPFAAVVVTLIMRRNYATGHSIGRRIGNVDALTKALRKELTSGGVEFVVNQVDYAEHDFDVQLNISRATDVLIAMHGAGLAQMMFMHPWGGVFEFFCPEKPSSNYRYHQLSNKMGLRYDSFSINDERNEVPIAAVMPQLMELGSAVAKDKRLYWERGVS